MCDYGVGDEVICIDVTPDSRTGTSPPHQLWKKYRVVEMHPMKKEDTPIPFGVVLAELPIAFQVWERVEWSEEKQKDRKIKMYWGSHRFRKEVPAVELANQMLADALAKKPVNILV